MNASITSYSLTCWKHGVCRRTDGKRRAEGGEIQRCEVEPLPLVGEGSDNYAGDEMVTKVVPVRNVSVRELAPILRQMIDSAGSGNVVNYDPSNVIMLTGRASVVERLTEVIQRVDHAGIAPKR